MVLVRQSISQELLFYLPWSCTPFLVQTGQFLLIPMVDWYIVWYQSLFLETALILATGHRGCDQLFYFGVHVRPKYGFQRALRKRDSVPRFVKQANFVSRPFVNWQELRFVTRGISFHCVPTTRPSSWSRGLSAPTFDCYRLASQMTAFRVYKISSFSVTLWISRSLDVDTGRKADALMFSNSAAVGCTVSGRYVLESVSAR